MNAAGHLDRPPPRTGSAAGSRAASLCLGVNTYEQPQYISRMLAAVTRLSSPPDQVLVADDRSGEETRETVVGWAARQNFPVGHLWHPNTGVRRLDVRGWAIGYHLWHPEASRERTPVNDRLPGGALLSQQAWCRCGWYAHGCGGSGTYGLRP